MDDNATRYEIAYREAIRALDLQRSAIDALRTRVGFLLSAAAIATSLFGGLALRDEADLGSWVAIGLFGAFGATALKVLWPRAEGAEGFTATPSVLIERYFEIDPQPELAEIYRNLALWAEEAHDDNLRAHLQPLTRWFRASIFFLTAEVVAWVVDLALR